MSHLKNYKLIKKRQKSGQWCRMTSILSTWETEAGSKYQEGFKGIKKQKKEGKKELKKGAGELSHR